MNSLTVSITRDIIARSYRCGTGVTNPESFTPSMLRISQTNFNFYNITPIC
jgi:hypothetical protein